MSARVPMTPLFALVDGTVKFERVGKDRKKVSVYEIEQ